MARLSEYGKENLKKELLSMRKYYSTRSIFIREAKRLLNVDQDKSLSNALRRRGLTNDFLKYELLL